MLILIISFVSIFISTGNKVEIKDAWLRTGAKGLNSALYFKIDNNTAKPDTLYKVSSNIAQHVQMHETYKKNDMMGMREINNLVIKPNSSVEFKPGSYHIMLIDLRKDLKAEEQIDFMLYFKTAGEVKIRAKVENK
jgi:periplasmic copper chaperone A